MLVLDIDLDFFLDDIPTPNTGEGRLSPDEFVPWEEDDVRSFLNDRCNVSKPLPGAIVTNHDEVFHRWFALIQAGELTTPFDLIHIDSHADMGMVWGRPSPVQYLYCNLLHRERQARIEECISDESWVDPGNYVLFAIACEWLSSLRYVHHPRLNHQLPDMADILFQDNNPSREFLQLKRYPMELENGFRRLTEFEPIGLEPEVPFQFFNGDELRITATPSYLFVAHSPEFTPPTSDGLLDVFRDFIVEQ